METAIETVAPVLKMKRRQRAVPKVKVVSRHRPDCKWRGDYKRIGCDCPKNLFYYRAGKQHWDSAQTCDGEVAEKAARDLMDSFEAAAKGEPTAPTTKGESFLIADLVDAFIAKKNSDTNKRGNLLKK